MDNVPIPQLTKLTELASPISETSTAPSSVVTYDPELVPDDDAIRRFWDKVVKGPRCWIFTGTVSSPDGYGRFTFQRNNRQRTMSAHRFALLVSGHELVPGLVGEHHCNEPLCVRVDADHLGLTTQAENLAWAVACGRQRGNKPGALANINRADRSRRVREAVKDGWDEDRYRLALQCTDENQLPLF